MMHSDDLTSASDARLRLRNWARQGLSAFTLLLAFLCLLVSGSSFGDAGWNNERTLLYAAEGGLMSPREALMQALIFGVAMAIWFVVFVATRAAANSRRRIFQSAATGAMIELALGATSGVLCGDWAVAVLLALPMALVAAVAWLTSQRS
jgi:hypothetical protein